MYPSVKSSVLRVLLIGLALWLLLWAALSYAAAPIKLCGLCSGYTISKRGDDVLIRCPGLRDPWLTVKGCRNPNARRIGLNVTLTCDWISP